MHYDAVIIGGGIAGLWTANALKSQGYNFALITNTPLGQGQTLASQGVIHGGAKYAVAGKLTDSSEQLAAMPDRWRQALAGRGDVDLSDGIVLSEHQILWSLPSVASQVISFFGSKMMRGRSDALPRNQWPDVLPPDQYRGRVFQIDEPVLDPVSIVKSLACQVAANSYFADAEIVSTSSGQIDRIKLGGAIDITADRYILTAGAGNQSLLEAAGIKTPKMQLRPLHQIIIRGAELPDFFSVCIGNTPKPPMVTTTHTDSQGRKIWWIGGDIAEAAGVARSDSEQITHARQKLTEWLPWINWQDYEIFTARADRAEPSTDTGDRPAGAFCQQQGNVIVTWPTKLALAPDLSDQVLTMLEQPTHSEHHRLNLTCPEIGKPPWDLD